ncbi:MAG: orotate phosphoribosyltransferase [Nitrososphaerales archaeon]|nr:orotate phosphoribosyltransferase [Nitrososphaerales archaeon]
MNWDAERQLLARDLGQILAEKGVVQFGNFTLSSGKTSPYYIDLRLIPSFPEVFAKVVTTYEHSLKTLIGLDNVGAVGGVPTSGLTYAAVVAHNLKKPLVYVREKNKTYGKGKKIEGVLKPGCKVALIDDLITTGGSLVKTIDALRQIGGEVDNVVVLIDRLEGGRDLLADKGVKLDAIITIGELADLLYEMDKIDIKQHEYIKSQIESNS